MTQAKIPSSMHTTGNAAITFKAVELFKGGNYVQKYGSLDQKSSFQNAALICADQKWIDFYALSFSFWGQFFLNSNHTLRLSGSF